MDKKISVAAYVRESKDENLTRLSTLNNQIEILQKYISNQPDWKLYDVYADDNFTGTTFSRPELNRLISDAEAGKVQIILLKDLSRLGRNNGKTLLFLDWAEELGVQVITTDGRYNSNGNTELAGIDTWFNERYAADISCKIRATLNMKIKAGEYIGTAPYGYTKSSPGHLEPEPCEALVVRRIYSMYLKGYGYSKISEILKGEKVPPPRTNWSPQSVKRILTSEVYIGNTIQGVSKKQSYKSKKTLRLPEDKWTRTHDTHKAIISREIFSNVQTEIQSRQKGQGNYSGNVPVLKNLLYCGFCGEKMYSKGEGYICSKYVKNGRLFCKRNFQYKETLKNELLEQLKKMMSLIEFEDEKHKDEILIKAKDQYKKRMEILYDDRLSGLISVDKYTELIERERKQYYRIKNQLEDNDINYLKYRFLAETNETVSLDLLRDILHATVEKCIVK